MIEREITGQKAKAAKHQKKPVRRGLTVERYFTTQGVDPADERAAILSEGPCGTAERQRLKQLGSLVIGRTND